MVPALEDPVLSAAAAEPLKRLCDFGRSILTQHMEAFAQLHSKMDSGIPPSERSKVLESVASVVQALPPAAAIVPLVVSELGTRTRN